MTVRPGFVLAEPQASTELLREHGRRLRGAQKEDGVDVGDVDTFAEHVDAEDATNACRLEDS